MSSRTAAVLERTIPDGLRRPAERHHEDSDQMRAVTECEFDGESARASPAGDGSKKTAIVLSGTKNSPANAVKAELARIRTAAVDLDQARLFHLGAKVRAVTASRMKAYHDSRRKKSPVGLTESGSSAIRMPANAMLGAI